MITSTIPVEPDVSRSRSILVCSVRRVTAASFRQYCPRLYYTSVLSGQHVVGYTTVEHVSRDVQVGRTYVWRKCSMANCHDCTVRAAVVVRAAAAAGGSARPTRPAKRARRSAGRSSAPTGRIGQHTP